MRSTPAARSSSARSLRPARPEPVPASLVTILSTEGAGDTTTYVEEAGRCGFCTATTTCCRFGLTVVCAVLVALCTALETKLDTKLDTKEKSALVPDPNPVFPEPDTALLRALPVVKLARENWLVNDPALFEAI